MFTKKENKTYFKSECKNYKYMMKKINDIDSELKYLAELMNEKTDVSNPEKKALILIEKESVLIKERDLYVSRMNFVDDTINKVDDPKKRGIIKALWIEEHSSKKISLNYYMSERNVYYTANSAIENVL